MYEYKAKVISNYDGDTFRADLNLGFGTWVANQPLRIYGVNTPKKGTPGGDAALAYVSTLLPIGTELQITTLKDKKEKFGRYLGKVTLPDGSDLAELIVINGYGVPYFGGKKTNE